MQQRRLWRAGGWMAAVAVLAGCAAGGTGASGEPGAETTRTPVAADEVQSPAVENLTGFPHVGFTGGRDAHGEYTSLGLKITYAITADGRLLAQTSDQERMVTASDDPAADTRCMAHGSGFNQRTIWFPDAAVFVAGARLTGVATADGQARPLLPLGPASDGALAASGPRARKVEYGYVPCVGAQRVPTGVRTDGYLQPGDRLSLQPQGRSRRAVTLTLPLHPRPFVLLNFARSEAQALVPANLVLLTVDWPNHRAVAQYQVTVPMRPEASKAIWSGTLNPTYIDAHPDMKPFNDAVMQHLATCPLPAGRPMDPCASPDRPLPAIFQR